VLIAFLSTAVYSDTLTCKCYLSTSPSTYTIEYDYRLTTTNSSAWVASYTTNTPTCLITTDFAVLNNTQLNLPLIIQSGGLALSATATYYCYMWNTLGNCNTALVGATAFLCANPNAPVAPVAPSSDAGGITGTPLGIGLACGMVILFIIVAIIVCLICRRQQQQKENV